MFGHEINHFSRQRIEKVGVIVGHTAKAPGARIVATDGRVTSEYEYHKSVMTIALSKQNSLGSLAPMFNELVFRDNIGIAGATNKIIESGVDLSIELHTNASNGNAVGCEAFYYMPNSKSICEYYCELFCERFKRKNRGAKDIKKNGRGVTNLSLLQDIPYSILVEPFFGDNKDEYISKNDYASFLAEFVKSIKLKSLSWR